MHLTDGMTCPICETGILQRVVRDSSFEHKGHITVIKDVVAYDCTVCGDGFLEDDKAIETILTEERRKVDLRKKGSTSPPSASPSSPAVA